MAVKGAAECGPKLGRKTKDLELRCLLSNSLLNLSGDMASIVTNVSYSD
jgi:hypothetical protein